MKTFVNKFMRNAQGTRLTIDYRTLPDNLKITITKDIDLFTKEPIYLFEATLYSVRGKIVTKGYKEFPQTKEGLKKAKDWKIRFNKMLGDGTWMD